MGQVSSPNVPSIFVRDIDRETGPGAGTGQVGNYVIFLGQNAGQDSVPAGMIAFGFEAMGGAGAGFQGPGSAGDPGSIAIGYKALSLVYEPFSGAQGPDLAIGYEALGNVVGAGGNIALGANAGQNMVGLGLNGPVNNILIGNGVMSTHQGSSAGADFDNVMVGTQIASSGGTSTAQILGNVVLGYRAGNEWDQAGTAVTSNVVIGTQANNGNTAPGGCVYIGNGVAQGQLTQPIDNVVIGSGAAGFNSISPTNNVAIGANILDTGHDRNVFIGFEILLAGYNRSIVIGAQAGLGEANNQNDRLIIETYDGATQRPMVYGYLNTGSLMLGSWAQADRAQVNTISALVSSNQIWLPNGLRGVGNPVDGGFFYVLAGALHWVGSAGTDTVVAVA